MKIISNLIKVNIKALVCLLILIACVFQISAKQYDFPQDSIEQDTLSKFQKMNQKAMNFFVYAPFPIFSYSQETGQVFGLVKYNMLRPVKSDTVSAPSSFSALASLSSLGQFKLVLGSTMYYGENNVVVKAEASYIKFPQYAIGVGNELDFDNLEKIESRSYNFLNAVLFAVDDEKTTYLGVKQQLSWYSDILLEDDSYFLREEYPGYEGGISSGLGPAFILDKRDHRYNTTKGYMLGLNTTFYESVFGSEFGFSKIELDARYFIQPWMKHVIGFQAFAEANYGEVPFYNLALMGGTSRMRGYYQGAIRDKVLADAQIEYRMPVFGAFGIVAFASAGRVADKYQNLNLNDLYYSAGGGIRIMVDKTNRANLRFDYGFGRKLEHYNAETGEVDSYRAHAFVVGFTESF